MSPTSTNYQYRPDIDGLRAIAVGTVVLFHAGICCSGGYIGVDVFFVISGFLITSLLLKDLDRGTFTFVGFWERRTRRIAPALFVVSAATLVAGWLLLLPVDLINLGRATASQAVFAANVFYWLDSGYFSAASDEKPLLHTWSLAVEEQFYFIAPVLLWALYHVKPLRGRTSLLVLMTLGIVSSFLVSVYGVARHPVAAFYLLPTRAWELLLGSLVATLPPIPSPLNRRTVRDFAATTGFASILVPAFLYTKETPFPGVAALAPCLGTALLIWANGRTEGTAPTFIARLLSLNPIVFVGLISYSLYLWHWPLLAFATYYSPKLLPFSTRLLAVAAGIALAILSWKYVETPFRQRKLLASTGSILTVAGLGLGSFVGIGILFIAFQGIPQRFELQSLSFADAETDRPAFNDVPLNEVRKGQLSKIGEPTASAPPSVVVWGDSHARSALPAFDELLKEKGIAGRAAIFSALPPVLDWYRAEKGKLGQDSVDYNESVVKYIEANQIADVFLVARWGYYRNANKQFDPVFTEGLLKTVKRIVESGARSWILFDVPNHSFNVPRGGALFDDIAPMSAAPSTMTPHDGFEPATIAQIRAVGGRFLDPKPLFLAPSGDHYIVQSNGVVLYFDKDHLTTKGARLVLLPFLRDALALKN